MAQFRTLGLIAVLTMAVSVGACGKKSDDSNGGGSKPGGLRGPLLSPAEMTKMMTQTGWCTTDMSEYNAFAANGQFSNYRVAQGTNQASLFMEGTWSTTSNNNVRLSISFYNGQNLNPPQTQDVLVDKISENPLTLRVSSQGNSQDLQPCGTN